MPFVAYAPEAMKATAKSAAAARTMKDPADMATPFGKGLTMRHTPEGGILFEIIIPRAIRHHTRGELSKAPISEVCSTFA
jgi:hypothetical protein